METTKLERYTGTFTERVIAWAKDRNIIGGSTPRDQFLKLVEEVGEIADGIIRCDTTLTKDGIGDSAVVVAVIAGQIGVSAAPLDVFIPSPLLHMHYALGELSNGIQKNDSDRIHGSLSLIVTILTGIAGREGMRFDDCCEHAWNEIKDRRGKLIGGVFVKEAG